MVKPKTKPQPHTDELKQNLDDFIRDVLREIHHQSTKRNKVSERRLRALLNSFKSNS